MEIGKVALILLNLTMSNFVTQREEFKQNTGHHDYRLMVQVVRM